MTETTPQDRIPLKNRTKLIHAGRRPSEQHGFVNTPVYRGSLLSASVAKPQVPKKTTRRCYTGVEDQYRVKFIGAGLGDPG